MRALRQLFRNVASLTDVLLKNMRMAVMRATASALGGPTVHAFPDDHTFVMILLASVGVSCEMDCARTNQYVWDREGGEGRTHALFGGVHVEVGHAGQPVKAVLADVLVKVGVRDGDLLQCVAVRYAHAPRSEGHSPWTPRAGYYSGPCCRGSSPRSGTQCLPLRSGQCHYKRKSLKDRI